jgi:L-iditol 2-dehydrogenase
MEALVKVAKGKGFIELKEVAVPAMNENDVLIKIAVAGICGTDIHIMGDSFHYNPPVILGHEFSGEIVEVGAKVTNFSKGNRVVSEPHKGGCGICRYCLTGSVEVCSNKRAIGYKIDGCFSHFIAMPATSLHRVPDTLSLEKAALTEPLAVVIKAVLERSVVEPGDFVVVTGCGPIGLLAAAAAKIAGARAVLITGMDGDEALRLPAAKAMGIDHTVNIQKEDLIKKVLELTDNKGADLVVEASGAEPAIAQAFDLIKIDGKISGIGLAAKENISLPWNTAMKKAARLSFSFSSTWTSWEKALDFLATGKINVEPLISSVVPLKDWQEAFTRLQRLEAIKILLKP